MLTNIIDFIWGVLKIREIFKFLFGKNQDKMNVRVFNSQGEARDSILGDLSCSNEVRMLLIRANTLTYSDGLLSPLLYHLSSKNVEVLMLNPYSAAGQQSIRKRELARDPKASPSQMEAAVKEVEFSAQTLVDFIKKDGDERVKCFVWDGPAKPRLLIFDSAAYVGDYHRGLAGKETPLTRHSPDNKGFQDAKDFFKQVRSHPNTKNLISAYEQAKQEATS